MKIQIHTARIGKPTRIYQEELVETTEVRLKTFVALPVEISQLLSEYWQRDGPLGPKDWVASLTKYYFFNDYLSILTIYDKADRLLGYYCDIVTPLQKIGDDYYRTDLVLDLWVTPSLELYELDWNEYRVSGDRQEYPRSIEGRDGNRSISD
jgi:hypothetical protein